MDDYANIARKIRITSLDSYGVGSLIIIDVIHIPYGCSVSSFIYFINTANNHVPVRRYGRPFGHTDYKENGQTQEK
jgi:hypothetical protein